MFYKILNYFLEKKLILLKRKVNNLLMKDLEEKKEIYRKILNKDRSVAFASKENMEESIDSISKRISVENKYIILKDYFRNDSKRKYMINNNFYKFLLAIEYLYKGSDVALNTGVLNAPYEIYETIEMVQTSFEDTMQMYGLK